MTTTSIQETELVTRTIARWGSAAAALIFGIAFLTDKGLYWSIVCGQFVQILLVVTIFFGYALAWKMRFEVLGSLIALAAMLGVVAYGWTQAAQGTFGPGPLFLVVGVPALLHLVAVMLHAATVGPHDAREGCGGRSANLHTQC